MTKEKNDKMKKAAEYRTQLMQGMSEEKRARFLRDMEIADQIMKENREVLKRLADS